MGRFRPTLLIFIVMLRYCYTDLVNSNRPLKCVVDPLTVAAIASPVIGGIANLFGQSSANKQNLKIARETNALNYKMFQEANSFNAGQAALARDYNTSERIASQGYNSASAQLSRLRAAGISPAFSQVSAGDSSPASSPSASAAAAPSMIAPHMEPLNYGQALPDLLRIAQVKNQMENNNIQADAAMIAAQSQQFDVKNGKMRQAVAAEEQAKAANRQADVAQKNAMSNQKQADAIVDKTYQETEALRIENDWKEKMIANGIDVSSKQAQAALTAAAAQMSQANTSAALANIKAITTPNEWEERGERLALDYTKMLVDYYKFVMGLDVDMEYKKNLISQGLQAVQYETSGMPKWLKDITGSIFETAVTYGVLRGIGRTPFKVTGFR